MNRTVLFLFLSIIWVPNAFCQRLHTISLQELSLNTERIPFTVAEVIDARRDKNSLGIIQLGLNNRPDIGVFATPGLTEIKQLVERAGLTSPKGLSMRISTLRISEVTKFARETAKAEINIDFFLRYADHYYYIYSVYTSIEHKGTDVTAKHAENIVTVFEKACSRFAQLDKEVNSDEAFTLDQLRDPSYSFRDQSNMPVIIESNYLEGYYTSFEEFANNQPSISIQCKIKIGNEILVRCDDGEESTTDLYGFAHNNVLYVLFHHKFYKLEKRNNGLYFYGPSKVSKNSGRNIGEALWQVGPNYISLTGEYSALYQVDLATGSIRNITGF